ncbi:MAG: hypothetical protein JSS32_05355 [Verrucomicrobia bacterium]|nr:hypothetical protein [Verrucomicrobiota bacterium]
MKIYSELPSLKTPVSLAIGNFDGVHFGHHVLLSKLKVNSAHTAVLTFSNHPREVLKNEPAPPLLSDKFLKFSLLEVHGIDTLIEIPFTKELAELSYTDFIALLQSKFPISRLILGEGDAIGKNREGTPDKLKSLGFPVETLPKFQLENQTVSSTHIRTLIASGHLSQAEKLLGRPYILSVPAHKKRFEATQLCLPPDGTYTFMTEEREPLSIQIATEEGRRWIQLAKPFTSPIIIASKIIEEFYV